MNYRRLCAIVAMLFFCVCGATAQTTTTGAINGTISDPTGAVISNALVVLTNLATGASQEAKSSASGSYRFDLLRPGDYTIVVDMAGFEKLRSKLTVNNSQVTSADLKLTVGSDAQTVTVESVATLLSADNANVATTESKTQIEEIPNSGNNMVYATKLVPGQGTGFGVIGSTLYTVDGLNNNDPYNASNNSGATNLMLGNNDVQEVTVTGNGYSGQFGGFIGSSVSFVTKSGGNRLHGDAAWQWTGTPMVANTYSHKITTPTITPRSREIANQWAAEISGPVYIPHLFNGRDKLFFLADAEGLRGILPASPVTVSVPSAAFQAYTLNKLAANGLTNSLPFYKTIFGLYNQAAGAHSTQPGNNTYNNTSALTADGQYLFPNATSTGCPTASASLSAADLQGLGFIGQPVTGTVNGKAALGTSWTGPAGACAGSYSSNALNFANEATEIFRIDAVLGASDKTFFRYAHDNGAQPTSTSPLLSIFNSISFQPQNTEQVNWTHLFGARATNNLILGSVWYSAEFGPNNLPATLAAFPAILSFGDSAFTSLGGSSPTGRNVTTLQFQDDVAVNVGAHTVKTGAKIFYIKENDFNFGGGTVPTESVVAVGAFINGGNNTVSQPTSDPAKPKSTANQTTFGQSFPQKLHYPVLFNQMAFYVEDDWKVNRAFSLTLALRLEHQGNIQCIISCITLPTAFPTLLTQTTHATSADIPYNQAYKFNQKYSLPGLQQIEWQPRVGFAYNPPILNESLVVRGGAGIFYDGLPGNIFDAIAKNPPISNTFSVAGDNLAPNESANTGSNLWIDTTAYNTAFVNGIATGTLNTIKKSLSPAQLASFTPPNLYSPQDNPHMYEIYKWNLEIQKGIGKKAFISVNYLGNHGLHKPFTNAGLNSYTPSATGGIAGLPYVPGITTPPSTTPAFSPIDQRFNNVYYYSTEGSTNYNGLITTFTQRFTAGSLITAGYTYGKTMDHGENGYSTGGTGTTDVGAPPNPYNTNQEYGPASSDIRNYLTLNYVYKVTHKFGNSYLEAAAGGWQVSGVALAYSGLPFTVIDTQVTSTVNKYATGAYGASLLATYLGGGQSHCNFGKDICLKTSQFSAATSVFSNGPRNAFRGPMFINTDLAVAKLIPLHWEGGTLNLGIQAFNVLNHLNFSRPTGSLNNSTFGTVASVVNPSGVFSGVGGDDSPRILQVKAKITF